VVLYQPWSITLDLFQFGTIYMSEIYRCMWQSPTECVFGRNTQASSLEENLNHFEPPRAPQLSFLFFLLSVNRKPQFRIAKVINPTSSRPFSTTTEIYSSWFECTRWSQEFMVTLVVLPWLNKEFCGARLSILGSYLVKSITTFQGMVINSRDPLSYNGLWSGPAQGGSPSAYSTL